MELVEAMCVLLPGRGCVLMRSPRKRSAITFFTAGLPDPDLIIRTSGEFRISNSDLARRLRGILHPFGVLA